MGDMPALGEHSEPIQHELGFDESQIVAMRGAGVISAEGRQPYYTKRHRILTFSPRSAYCCRAGRAKDDDSYCETGTSCRENFSAELTSQ